VKTLNGLLLGATDQEKEGTFIWESSKTKLSFSAWIAGEPNDLTHTSNCIEVYFDAWQWNDIPCNELYLTIMCEMIFPCH
jgi:hypothetical protein